MCTPCFLGAGIKDQDRNIHLNQQLIVNFLQSSATLLAKGVDPTQLPSSGKRKKRKRRQDEGDDDDDDGGSDIAFDEEEREQPGVVRGSILITLRDASPYTLWYVGEITRGFQSHPVHAT